MVMNVVSALFRCAEEHGVLGDLKQYGIRHRVSLYADDVVVFAKPCQRELEAVFAILRWFGMASGLVVNYSKSVAIPIRCSQETIDTVTPALPCPIGQFPCRYLGLPLSLSKPTRADVQPLIDKLARKLPFWKARLLTREGRISYVQVVLSASAVYHLLALDLDPWVLQMIDRIRRGFIWAGRKDARGGSCLVAWDRVCQPKSLGGLGLHNLRWLSAALRARWIWFQRTSDCKPWSGLDVAVSSDALALYRAATKIEVGSGASVLFWMDPWIQGHCVAALAPALLKLVRPGVVRSRTVLQGRENNAWVLDIAGTLTVDAVVQFLHLWPRIQAT
jgi:hypothetical protein